MKLPNRDKDVSKEDYQKIANFLIPLQIKVSDYFHMPISDLRWNHFVIYSNQVLNYDFLYHDYGDIASKFISGRTTIIDGIVSIVVNVNSSHNSGRQHFTTLHEISHGFLHIERGKLDEVFFSKQKIHTPDDVQSEIEADILASLMLISDKALIKQMKSNPTFINLCFVFECSYANLHTRLKNYLVFNLNFNEHFAQRLVSNYRNYDDTIICELINHLKKFEYYYCKTSVFESMRSDDYRAILVLLDLYENMEKIRITADSKEIIAKYIASKETY